MVYFDYEKCSPKVACLSTHGKTRKPWVAWRGMVRTEDVLSSEDEAPRMEEVGVRLELSEEEDVISGMLVSSG